MPIVTTQNQVNLPIQGARPYIQAYVKVINNDTEPGTCYLKGVVNNANQQTAFAEDLFVVNPGEVINRTYNLSYDHFQFNATFSKVGIEVVFYGITAVGLYIPFGTEEVDVSRITSEIRAGVNVTDDDDYAALSFQRNPNFANPNGVAAAVYVAGFDILTQDPVRYTLIEGGTVDGVFTNYPTTTTQIPATDTVLQVNTTCTSVNGGRVVTQGTIAGFAGAYANTNVNLIQEGVTLRLEGGEPLTLVINSLLDEINVVVVVRMLEQW